ncbi:MAG: transposase, partial [Verrucomicrobia bacterium]|nr:transposase [Verrucomicrobiota bacterium]
MRKIRKYDKEFKLNAIKLYQESKKDHKEIAENLGIPS